MDTDTPSETATDINAERRRAFFEAADRTLREGGYVHSELIAQRAGVEIGGADLINLMREWSESREYPLSKIGWSRMGAILSGIVGAAGTFFGLAIAITARRISDGERTAIAVVTAIVVAALLTTAVRLWNSTSRLRQELIDRANSHCPECQSAVDTASGQCACGYLRTQPTAAIADGSTTSPTTPRAADGPVPADPMPLPVWELATDGGAQQLAGLDAIRDAILSGAVSGDDKARGPAPEGTDEEPAWQPVRELAESEFQLAVLFRPVWAHTMRAAGIGAAIGIGWWLLSLVVQAFTVMDNPVIGGLSLLMVWGIVNLALPPQVVFFSSRFLWGAVGLGSIAAFQNFGWAAVSQGLVPGLGMFAGAVFAGAIVGALLGMAVGTVVGFVRRERLETAPAAIREETTPLLVKGMVVPLLAVVVLVTVYVYWVLPWLLEP